jgi:hypothetical protein
MLIHFFNKFGHTLEILTKEELYFFKVRYIICKRVSIREYFLPQLA